MPMQLDANTRRSSRIVLPLGLWLVLASFAGPKMPKLNYAVEALLDHACLAPDYPGTRCLWMRQRGEQPFVSASAALLPLEARASLPYGVAELLADEGVTGGGESGMGPASQPPNRS